jgi:hypothetical protein
MSKGLIIGGVVLLLVIIGLVVYFTMMGGEKKPVTTSGPSSPGPAGPGPTGPSFTESCKDFVAGTSYGDDDTVTTLDGCKASCANNTHGRDFTCKGLIYADDYNGSRLCRLYVNKDLDSSVDICSRGLKSYTLN